MEFVEKGIKIYPGDLPDKPRVLAVSILTNSKKENYARTKNNYLQSWRH
jgi:hypothetical protein